MLFDDEESGSIYGWNDYQIYKSSDSGWTWDILSNPGGPITGVVRSSLDENTFFCSANYSNLDGCIYISKDRCMSWNKNSNNLWEYGGKAQGLFVGSPNSHILYFTLLTGFTEAPIIQSHDDGVTWYPMSEALDTSLYKKTPVVIADPNWAESPWLLLDSRIYRWIPENHKPCIPLAGVNPNAVEIEKGGFFNITARVVDPDGIEDIDRVELRYQGVSLGIQLIDDGRHGDAEGNDGLFGAQFYWGKKTGVPGRYCIELVAVDQSGIESDPWPYLTINDGMNLELFDAENWIGPEIHEHNDPLLSEFDYDFVATVNAPQIAMGGWAFSNFRQFRSNHGELVALVFDPEGSNDINLVELFYQGYPTGLVLFENNTGSYCSVPGCYSFSWGMKADFPGAFLFEISATDRNGNRSYPWPYLTAY
jgi:hypothetical protein